MKGRRVPVPAPTPGREVIFFQSFTYTGSHVSRLADFQGAWVEGGRRSVASCLAPSALSPKKARPM